MQDLGGTPAISEDFDAEAFRDVVGHFASGVTVITARHSGEPYGTTASAVSSLSLEPPMVLVCLNQSSSTRRAVASEGRLAVNILGEDQADLARRFATKRPDKFDGINTFEGLGGVPLLTRASAWLECRVAEEVTGGTHSVFLSEVVRGSATGLAPLAYYRGEFGRIDLGSSIVRPFAVDGFADAVRAQEAIELGAAVMAVGKVGDEQLERLTHINESLAAAITLSAWMATYSEFHGALVEMAGSHDLATAHARVNTHLTVAALLEGDSGSSFAHRDEHMAKTYLEHREMLEALRDRNVERVLRLISLHHERVISTTRAQVMPRQGDDTR